MNVHSLLSGDRDMKDREYRKKRITEQRQQQLLEAAAKVFTSKGYAAATVPEIAAAAGVAVGTIYNYYPGKRALFIAVIKDLIITVPLLDLINGIPGGDIGATFRQIMQNRLQFIDTSPVARIPSLMSEIQRDPDLKILWADEFLRPFFTRMEDLYRSMMASGKFRQMEPVIATRAIGGLILGFLMLKIMEGEDSPLNRLPLEAVTDGLAGIILHGLAVNQPPVTKKEDKL
jgi:AcrR family transcriptional regulator